MKNGLIATALVVLLTGCASQTPREVMDDGKRSIHVLSKPPSQAAACMASNVENYRGVYGASVRETDLNKTELVVRINGSARTVVVAEVIPRVTGSEATIWITTGALYRSDEVIPAMIEGC